MPIPDPARWPPCDVGEAFAVPFVAALKQEIDRNAFRALLGDVVK